MLIKGRTRKKYNHETQKSLPETENIYQKRRKTIPKNQFFPSLVPVRISTCGGIEIERIVFTNKFGIGSIHSDIVNVGIQEVHRARILTGERISTSSIGEKRRKEFGKASPYNFNLFVKVGGYICRR